MKAKTADIIRGGFRTLETVQIPIVRTIDHMDMHQCSVCIGN